MTEAPEVPWPRHAWAAAVLAWPVIGMLVTALRNAAPLSPEPCRPLVFIWEWLPWGVWIVLVPLIVELTLRVDAAPRLRKVAVHAAGIIALSILHMLLVLGLAALMPPDVLGWQEETLRVRVMTALAFAFMSNGMIYVATAVAVEAYEHSRRSRHHQLMTARLEREAAEAELHLVEMQVHPQLLLRTLDALESMLQSRKAAAEDLLETFSRFLRLSLRRMTGGRDARGDFALVEALLELQRVRHDGSFSIEQAITATDDDLRRTSFDVQPVLERIASEESLWSDIQRVVLQTELRGRAGHLTVRCYRTSGSTEVLAQAVAISRDSGIPHVSALRSSDV